MELSENKNLIVNPVVYGYTERYKENIATLKLNGGDNDDENGDETIILMILEREPNITAKR